ncbi:piggyBac transposable element-derived protein 4-like [Vespula maculifrons]|uniref:PiggyBac transposable element-derived protein 4-like n=1 Tax=Vespula maculifrons TaxID=7453 RepID=A0ABD2BVI7_VESMC
MTCLALLINIPFLKICMNFPKIFLCSIPTYTEMSHFDPTEQVWNKFVENNQMYYKPETAIIIDEQLFPAKVKCKFTQYITNQTS